GVLIDAFRDGARVPALLVSGVQNAFPVEPHGIASNLAGLLNGGGAREELSSNGAAIHYHRHAHGVTLQHRDPAAGVSVPGLHITVLGSLPDVDRDAVLSQLSPAFMKSLCASIDTRATGPAGPSESGPKRNPQP